MSEKDRIDKLEKNYNELIKPVDGALPCIHKKLAEKISIKVFITAMIIILGSVGGAYTAVNVSAKDHKEFATKKELAELKKDLVKSMDRIDLQMRDNKNELSEEMKDMKKDILEAIQK